MSDEGYRGAQDLDDSTSDLNTWNFLIQAALRKVRTIQLVEVLSCTNSGGVTPAGTVNVKPLVNQVDGKNQGTPHGTIYNRPYMRWRAGTFAIIMDPEQGDIGLLLVCDRDTSTALSALAPANPGSRRKFDFADGFFLQMIGQNITPTAYVQFLPGAINVVHPTQITLTAPTIDLVASTVVNFTTPVAKASALIEAVDDVVAGFGTDNISALNHLHSDVTPGVFDTGPPVVDT